MNRKQQIKAQIAELQHEGWYATDNTEAGPVAATMQALLDVAVAADEYEKMFARSRTKPYGISNELQALFDALDKLREVSE